jgi:hypothetical protein
MEAAEGIYSKMSIILWVDIADNVIVKLVVKEVVEKESSIGCCFSKDYVVG